MMSDSINENTENEISDLPQEMTEDQVDQALEKMRHEESMEAEAADETPDTSNEGVDHSVSSENAHQENSEAQEEGRAKPDPQELANNYKAALHQERSKRKDLVGDYEKLKESNAELQQQLQSLLEQQENVGDKDTLKNLELKQSAIEIQLQQQRNNEQAQQFLNSMRSEASKQEEAFIKEHPDYYDAYNHLRSSITQEYKMLGYSDEQITQYINNAEFNIVSQAMQNDKNVASMVYDLAKTRGYAANQSGISPDQKFAMHARGVQANKSFSNTTGQEGNPGITPERLADLDGDEFEKEWANLFGSEKSSIF